MTTIRGCTDPEWAIFEDSSRGNVPEKISRSVTNDLRSSLHVGLFNKCPVQFLERIRNLPYRMAEVLEKPNDNSDFFAAMSEIDALAGAYNLSYGSNTVEAVWLGMESWLQRLSYYFKKMVWHHRPAALVVVAHWTLLVKRVEYHCWYLIGLAKRLLYQIAQEVSNVSAARSLVAELMD